MKGQTGTHLRSQVRRIEAATFRTVEPLGSDFLCCRVKTHQLHTSEQSSRRGLQFYAQCCKLLRVCYEHADAPDGEVCNEIVWYNAEAGTAKRIDAESVKYAAVAGGEDVHGNEFGCKFSSITVFLLPGELEEVYR